VAEVEGSVVGALEGWIRDPVTIILNFAVLFYISPQLTAFVLLFIPIVGFVIGRITRSLKKQSIEVAQKYSESVSLLDETLGGLRVIKAFTIEPLLRNKFFVPTTSCLQQKTTSATAATWLRPFPSSWAWLSSAAFFISAGGWCCRTRSHWKPHFSSATLVFFTTSSIRRKRFPLRFPTCRKEPPPSAASKKCCRRPT
jgi:ABC-type multidrug transport system fused ATPase/permease subunit